MRYVLVKFTNMEANIWLHWANLSPDCTAGQLCDCKNMVIMRLKQSPFLKKKIKKVKNYLYLSGMILQACTNAFDFMP